MSALTTASSRPPVVHLFRYDLRIHDHPSLTAAVTYAKENSLPLVNLYCFDPNQTVKQSPLRLKFTRECVADLASKIPLTCAVSDPASHVKAHYPNSKVFLQSEPCRDERLPSLALDATETFGGALIDADDLPFPVSECPNVFTPFRSKVEKGSGPREPLPDVDFAGVTVAKAEGGVPSLEDLGIDDGEVAVHEGSALGDVRGGEAAALARLKQYVWDEDR